jgi:hypothetical protein
MVALSPAFRAALNGGSAMKHQSMGWIILVGCVLSVALAVFST